jgi:Domain of unknown function (DUF1995)
MSELPKTLNEAIDQARAATESAIADGNNRLQVEILFPELNPMPVAERFLSAEDGNTYKFNKIFFPDAGAAALARRDWGEVPFDLLDISTKRVSVEEQIQPEDEAILCIAPTAQEVLQIEKLCNAMGDRPVVLLNPRLEDVSIVGIGYAGRQLRDRFLKNIQSCYYLRPLEEGTLFRCYPGLWQVWRETTDGYELIKELPNKPVGDDLDLIFAGETATQSDDALKPKKLSMFASMQRFMKALSR